MRLPGMDSRRVGLNARMRSGSYAGKVVASDPCLPGFLGNESALYHQLLQQDPANVVGLAQGNAPCRNSMLGYYCRLGRPVSGYANVPAALRCRLLEDMQMPETGG